MQRDLLDEDTRGDPVWELAALVEHEIVRNLHVGGYAIAQLEDEGDRDRPFHFGLRARGEPFADRALSGFSFWADAGLVRGEADGRSLRGWGFDIGAMHSFDHVPGRPRVQFGYALGSGDNDDGGNDRAFRQTGLQANEAERGALAKYKYYGEVLDPELSNLGILTVGAGVTFGETASLDVIYHRYDKHRRGGDLRDIALSADADEGFRDVGSAIDLVMGLRPDERVEIEAGVGFFRPGRAFRERDDALFARFAVDFRF